MAQFLKLPNAVAFLTAQVASNEHDEQEVLVQSLCAFLLGLCVVFNNDANSNFTKVTLLNYILCAQQRCYNTWHLDFSVQESLCQLVTKRIGVETFLDKLAEIAKHEVYSKGLKHPQIRIVNIWDVQLDHEFCRLYKGKQHILNMFLKYF